MALRKGRCNKCDGELFTDLTSGLTRCMACEIRFKQECGIKSTECTVCHERFVADNFQHICKSCARDMADKAQPKTANQAMAEEQAKGFAEATRRVAEEKGGVADRYPNVLELGQHAPTVESVLSRLYRNMDDIVNVVVFVEHKNKTCNVAYNTMSSEMLTYAAASVTHKINKVVFEEE